MKSLVSTVVIYYYFCIVVNAVLSNAISPMQLSTNSNDNNYQKAIGIVVSSSPLYQSTTTKMSNSKCFLLDNNANPIKTFKDLPNDIPLVKSLGLLCDVVVIICTDKISIQELMQALKDGVDKRITAGLSKPRLVIVQAFDSDIDDETQKEISWKDQIVLKNELANVTPDLWSRLEILKLDELENAWSDIRDYNDDDNNNNNIVVDDGNDAIASYDNKNFLNNVEIFPNIFNQVYKTFGGHYEPILIQPNSESNNNNNNFIQVDDKNNDNIETTQDTTTTTIDDEIDSSISSTSNQKTNDIIINDNNNDDSVVVSKVLSEAHGELEALESKLEEVWLDEKSDRMPLLDFQVIANQVLEKSKTTLSQKVGSVIKNSIMDRIASRIRHLYQQQLEALREYYGKRYEAILDKEDNEDAWKDAAAHMTEGFRAAAQNAIPDLCRVGGELRNADFEYVGTLQGLISDMMEATQLRQDEQYTAAIEKDDDDDDGTTKVRVKSAKMQWLEKLAARAFVIGVNYLQGWLAWQGVKRAAMLRDQTMQKFPLF